MWKNTNCFPGRFRSRTTLRASRRRRSTGRGWPRWHQTGKENECLLRIRKILLRLNIHNSLFPFHPLSSCQTFLASHLRTDWLSWLGLGNQVGSTTDHLTITCPAMFALFIFFLSGCSTALMARLVFFPYILGSDKTHNLIMSGFVLTF